MAEDDLLARPAAPVASAPQRRTSSSHGRSYDADAYGWAMDQAAYIRAGRYDLLDIENVAEEIESLGRHEFDVLVSNLEIILLHMLKWHHQSERRSRSLALSIAERRDRVAYTMSDNPSLAPRRDEALERAFRLARKRAAIETECPISTFPAAIPYTWTQALERSFVHGTE